MRGPDRGGERRLASRANRPVEAVNEIEAFVLGRLAADLYPLQSGTPLDEVQTFGRFVGGFGGNVGTGLARLGIRTAVLSGVGDDGHGRFLLRSLETEGVDARWVTVHPTLRTALAFCELWPPDRFPLTAYRMPTCPDWELRLGDLPLDLLRRAPLLYVSGTALAREPSRSAALGALEARRGGGDGVVATIIDLDWRREYWEHPEEYPLRIRLALEMADTVIGGESEFEGARLSPAAAMEMGPGRAFIKRGPNGAVALEGDERDEVGGLQVEVVNGLGAGDAFAAAVGYGLLKGMARADILRLANAAGAMVTMQLPCAAAMPRPHELEAFLDSLP